MVAQMYLEEDYELEAQPGRDETETRRSGRDMSSRDQFAARARFGRRRSGRGGQVNGAHRRRDKRNYL